MNASEPYQVMPPLSEAEYDALKSSIAAGYDPARPVVVDENGIILDGHHRSRACAELGITPPTVTLPGLTEEQKHDYAMRANLACRHLTQLQKRELIHAELDRDPARSDREIGRLCGADHKTVGAVRRESSGEIPRRADLRLAATVQQMIDAEDEIEAARAEAEATARAWCDYWDQAAPAVLYLARHWTSACIRQTGAASCAEWLHCGEQAANWQRLTENVRLLQSYSRGDTRMAELFGVRDNPIEPDVDDVEAALAEAVSCELQR